MINLYFYNIRTRQKDIFAPIDPKKVRLYVCGPTVYDNAHIGNARPVIVFDMLFRLLRFIYGAEQVIYARNITDVDDKINARAAKDYPALPLNEAIWRLTEKTNMQFQSDATALGCLPPTTQPRATEHLDDMRAVIERLIERGHAYVAQDHVLFSVASMRDRPAYGALARRSLDEMLAGARVDVAGYKRDEMDFVLWKPSKAHEPGWSSPAGIAVLGRPGWHIECSAMSMAKLLTPYGGGLASDNPLANIFDIHGGGADLLFPHHENETAQSCAAFGTEQMANYWMHNGMVQLEGQKMSKSLGHFITIRGILESPLPEVAGLMPSIQQSFVGLAARFSMLQTHYREPLNWTYERLLQAGRELYRWYDLLRKESKNVSIFKPLKEDIFPFAQALGEDLNSPKAITLLRQAYKRGDVKALIAGISLLGLADESFLTLNHPIFAPESGVDEKYINACIAERLTLIHNKNWVAADAIRDELAARNIALYDIKDAETGKRFTRWEVKKI